MLLRYSSSKYLFGQLCFSLFRVDISVLKHQSICIDVLHMVVHLVVLMPIADCLPYLVYRIR
jgi:hypothetical protein